MHPPQHILDKLQSLHPMIRLGWWSELAGGPDSSDDESNRGCFVLLQLYHKRDADRTYLDSWNSTGPVFGKDYDHGVRTPIWLKRYSKRDVFNGDIIGDVIEMLRPYSERYIESAQAKGAMMASKMKDISGDAGEFLYHRARKSDHASNIARKFAVRQEPKHSSDDLKDRYMPKVIPGAVPIS